MKEQTKQTFEHKCTTVRELRLLIADMPDEWVLLTVGEDGGGRNVTAINNCWNDALTFETD